MPIVLKEFQGRPVLLYNQQNRSENPMRSVEFTNSTGLTLEGGPVTVLEEASYVGEAMLDTLKPDEERLVPYAVELSVHVLDNVESTSEKVHRVVIRKGQLRTHYLHTRLTTYHFNNKSEREYVVYLEHPREGAEWKLHFTPEPKEITESFWRFRFNVAAKQVTHFTVRQRQTLHSSFALCDVNNQQLGLWLEQKFLDAKTEKALRLIVELRGQVAAAEGCLQYLEKERGVIHAEEKRIRENLQALGDRPSEKDLRERLIKSLNVQEDRLEQIAQEIRAKTKERDELREKMNQALAKLDYEAEV
ncbi:MAG: hypothetical protein L0215_21820 [Gemmataceae bacterium]|nr:hypothetical protein [Gemmataceae bacterium]